MGTPTDRHVATKVIISHGRISIPMSTVTGEVWSYTMSAWPFKADHEFWFDQAGVLRRVGDVGTVLP